jgi:signal transduction histidine kinase
MTISNRSFQRWVFATMGVAVLLLVLAGWALVAAARDNARRTAWVVHTYEVGSALDKFTILTEQLETARRAYLLWHRPGAVINYQRTMAAIPHQLDYLQHLTQDNAAQQVRVAALRREAEIHRASARETMTRLQSDNPAIRAMADFSVDRSLDSMRALRGQTAAMAAEERVLLTRRLAAQDRATLSLDLILAALGTLIALLLGGTLWLVLRYTADLNRAQASLAELNAGLENAVAARTVELTRANDEIQRFAYIVSHDLRSPLVNVMGFTAELEGTIAPLTTLIDRVDAEAPALMTREARDAKADLPEAIGFIRTSTAKMDRLINAILRLSREGRRTLQPAPIDLAALTATVRDTFQHRLTEIGAEIDVAGPFPPLVSDRLALEQILSNLVENAVKYLAPGRPGRIAVTARQEGDRVIIDVSDNGRGIAPADHERIFELFRRSGVQDQRGEGLGLAHVRALSYRLGGIINCISSLGEGATFRLSLPQVLEGDGAKEGVR